MTRRRTAPRVASPAEEPARDAENLNAGAGEGSIAREADEAGDPIVEPEALATAAPDLADDTDEIAQSRVDDGGGFNADALRAEITAYIESFPEAAPIFAEVAAAAMTKDDLSAPPARTRHWAG